VPANRAKNKLNKNCWANLILVVMRPNVVLTPVYNPFVVCSLLKAAVTSYKRVK
jgi:hypothetical protein